MDKDKTWCLHIKWCKQNKKWYFAESTIYDVDDVSLVNCSSWECCPICLKDNPEAADLIPY